MEKRIFDELFLMLAETTFEIDFSIITRMLSNEEVDCLKIILFLSHHKAQITREGANFQIDVRREL